MRKCVHRITGFPHPDNLRREPTPASDVSIPYRQYASHGSYRVRGAAGVVHLCNTDDVSRLVETMRPPPDAVVWGYSLVQMPPTTETISVDNGWDEAVRGISQAERNQRRAVAVWPPIYCYGDDDDYNYGDDVDDLAITPLLHHVTSRRQHRADHIIVVYCDQHYMTWWQQQLEEDTRVIRLA